MVHHVQHRWIIVAVHNRVESMQSFLGYSALLKPLQRLDSITLHAFALRLLTCALSVACSCLDSIRCPLADARRVLTAAVAKGLPTRRSLY